jgi:predicted nucleotidyltransferase component of viral defense system
MELNILNNFSKQLQIAPEFIVREYWEMVLLQELANSTIGSNLVFKGGTALRLAYNSPRFSMDLDFSLNKNIEQKDIEQILNKIIRKYGQLKIKDVKEKFYTFFAQIIVTEENLARNFSIKIEISKRMLDKKDVFEPKLLTSPVTQTQALLNTHTMTKIKTEKLEAIKTRRQARDLFDLWYIAGLERIPWQVPPNNYTMMELKNDLNRLLPSKFKAIAKQLIYKPGPTKL